MMKFISKFFYSIEWLVIILFFLTAPAVFSEKLLDPVLFPRLLALSWLLLILTLILGFRVLKNKFRFYFNHTDQIVFISVLLFFLVHVISSFFAYNGKEAIIYTVKNGAFALIFFYFHQLLRDKPDARKLIIKAIIIVTAIFLIIGIVQVLKGDFTKFKQATSSYGYYFNQALSNVHGRLGNKNLFSDYFYLSLVFSIYGALIFRRFWRLFSILVALTSIGFIGILNSRATWAAFMIAVMIVVLITYIYMFWFYPKEHNRPLPQWIKVGLVLLPFVGLSSASVLIRGTNVKVVQMIVLRAKEILQPNIYLNNISSDNPSSAQTRTMIWSKSLQMAKDHPLLGVGPGNWKMLYAKYGLDGFEEDIRQGVKLFQRPHNDFLWIAAETGFTGLILFILIYVIVIYTGIRNLFRNRDNSVRVFNLLGISVLIGFSTILFVTFDMERVMHSLLYLLIFSIILFDYRLTSFKEVQIKKPLLRFGIPLIVIGFTIFNISILNQLFKGEKAARNIRVYKYRQNWNAIIREARSVENSIYTMDPFSAPLYLYKGESLAAVNRIEDAKMAFLKAYEIHPYHLMVLNNLATSYDMTGDRKTAISYYKKALSFSPRYKEALVNLAIVYYNDKNMDSALTYLVKVPFGAKDNPVKYDQAVYAITANKAYSMVEKLDTEKLKIWSKDRNKVSDTFVKHQKSGINISEILIKELGK